MDCCEINKIFFRYFLMTYQDLSVNVCVNEKEITIWSEKSFEYDLL